MITKEFLEENVISKLSETDRDLVCNFHDEEELKRRGFKSRSERDMRIITILKLKGFGEYIKSIFSLFPCGDKFREHSSGDKYLEHQIKSAIEYTGVDDEEFIRIDQFINNMDERLLRNKIDIVLFEISKVKYELKRQYLIGQLAFRTKINKNDLNKKIRLILSNKPKNPIPLDILLKKGFKVIKYYMKPLIPSEGKLILIGGKPGRFKPFFVLAKILCMISNTKFLNQFEIEKVPKVLMYNFDGDGEDILINRVNYLKNGGLNITEEQMKNLHVEFNFNKGNMEEELELAKNYDIIILDSYRRFLDGAENESAVTDKFYQEFLKKLKELDKTIIIVHHFKKERVEDINDDDLMDLFRGSSDIPSQFDLILGMFTSTEVVSLDGNTTTFNVRILKVKNRLGLPIENFSFKVIKNLSENSTKLEYLGNIKLPSPKQRNKEAILEFLKGKEMVPRGEILELLPDCSIPVIDGYLKQLVKEGLIIQPRHGYYALSNEL